MVNTGLDGIVAATTHLSHVDGERGELIIPGFPVGELAEHATFEETTWLLWHGQLPSARQLDTFGRDLANARALPAPAMVLLVEQQRANRIIRPQSEYVGPRHRTWVAVSERG